ncbi:MULTISPECIES: NUDIX hydrolase [unclassified Virgibacillus]|uniref:NUDIX hydrolase n=1 Tax=unclassified Virgibacillus TaxID=2620237 RepID=UPI0024DE35F5|nr:NUDIX hydrolase [Virgibacillus sp. LDC-1]
MSNDWLNWARKIQAIAQSGLSFTKDKYDEERYTELLNISAEIMSKHTNATMTYIEDLYANEIGYQTPKIDVRGVVFKNNTLLLVQEKSDGKWALPGGFCDVGLSAAENIIKEIKEEAGCIVTTERLLALLDNNKQNHPPQAFQYYKIFIQCKIIYQEEASNLTETSNVGFFTKDNIPPLSTGRNTKQQIHKLFEFLNDPCKPVWFD